MKFRSSLLKKSLALASVFLVCSIFPASAAFVADDFNSYSNGALSGQGAWTTHSGTTGEVDVASGAVNLTFSQGEDVNLALTGAPSTGMLYTSFSVNFSALPNAAGTYFAHYKDAANGFRNRIWTSTTNASVGTFRLGIGNSSAATNASGQFALDLSLGTNYTVVTRYNLDTGISSIWIDPTQESDTNVTAGDAAGTLANTSFALRQTTGMGTLVFDNLIIGTTFADVLPVPEPSTYALIGLGLGSLVFLRRMKKSSKA